MNVILLNPPFVPAYSRSSRWAARGRGGTLYYPIWLSYCAAALSKTAHTVHLIDAPAWGWSAEKVIKEIERHKPILCVIDVNFQSLTPDLEIAQLVKKASSCTKTVVVGPPAAIFTNEILEREYIDFVASYEYDSTIVDLLNCICNHSAFNDIDGLSYKQDKQIVINKKRRFLAQKELDSIPFVSKVYNNSLEPKNYYLSHTLYPMVQIITSRGCPNLCTFCSWPQTFMGRQVRFRSAGNVVDELQYIRDFMPSIKEVFFEDDTFTINKKRVQDICNEILRRGIKLPWSCNARADLDYDTMVIMKSAGCRLLDVGYESGNDDILINIKKGITTETMRRFSKDAKKAKLRIMADFVVGLPGESVSTFKDTMKYVREIQPDYLQYSVATPIPGTEFYEYASSNGYMLNDIECSLDIQGYQQCIISYPNFTKEDIEYYVKHGLMKYYLSYPYALIALRQVFSRYGLHDARNLLRSGYAFLKYIGGRQ